MSNAIADLDTVALAAAIAAREVSPMQAGEAAGDRIEQCRPLNAFITVAADQAFAALSALTDSPRISDDRIRRAFSWRRAGPSRPCRRSTP